MRRLFGGRKRLRKSQSVQYDKTKNHCENNNNTASTSVLSPATGGKSTDNGSNNVPHEIFLTPSRTFDASRCYRSSESVFASGASTRSGDLNFDPGLDRSMIQTITDVKYINRRPKFTAVVDANFQRQCFEAHNLVRQKYGSPALIWSQELADLAKSWALKLTERGRILYPELPGIGENIYFVMDERGDHLTTGAELIAIWSAEADHFNFMKPQWNLKCKNFTQMIWRSSIEMGVARYWNVTKNCLSIVAFYRPGGNFNAPGDFAVNLPTKAELPEDARSATQINSLVQSLNRYTFNDVGLWTRSLATQSSAVASASLADANSSGM